MDGANCNPEGRPDSGKGVLVVHVAAGLGLGRSSSTMFLRGGAGKGRGVALRLPKGLGARRYEFAGEAGFTLRGIGS